MSASEADEHISKLQDSEIKPLCWALLGRIDRDQLNDELGLVFDKFQQWSEEKTTRIRNEEWSARRRQKETKLSLRFVGLHQQGQISDRTLLLYGISGDMPEWHYYHSLSVEEKESFWAERVESRFGPNWREIAPAYRQIQLLSVKRRQLKTSWTKFGF